MLLGPTLKTKSRKLPQTKFRCGVEKFKYLHVYTLIVFEYNQIQWQIHFVKANKEHAFFPDWKIAVAKDLEFSKWRNFYIWM